MTPSATISAGQVFTIGGGESTSYHPQIGGYKGHTCLLVNPTVTALVVADILEILGQFGCVTNCFADVDDDG
ncbi:MAG: hypothetical protein P8L80_03470, partial [Flavobacteriales bacterium]|nr:hypothetical protein [Flavobacteriales bacterium]